jgi:excinuclease ABC subunit A
LFIFDEPTTGLHFHDISKLLYAFNALIKQGHSLIIIEHNAEVIKSADWIIDLGPEGGTDGGNIVFEGTPENIVKCKESYTGKYLKGKL